MLLIECLWNTLLLSSISNKSNVKKQSTPLLASETTSHPTIRMCSFTCIPMNPPDVGDSWQEQGKHARCTYKSIVHGLKQCIHCGRYWNRDVSVARNINWCFLSLCLTGQCPPHLRCSINKKQRMPSYLTLDIVKPFTTVISTTSAEAKVMVKSR